MKIRLIIILFAFLLSAGCIAGEPEKTPATPAPQATFVVSTPLPPRTPSPDVFEADNYSITAGGNTEDGVIWDYYHALDTGSFPAAFSFIHYPVDESEWKRTGEMNQWTSIYAGDYGLRGDKIRVEDIHVVSRSPIVPCQAHDPFIPGYCQAGKPPSAAYQYSLIVTEQVADPPRTTITTMKAFTVSCNGTWYFLEGYGETR